MKICIPITNLSFEGNVVFDLAKELAKQGHKPTIIAPHAKGLLLKEKVKGVEIKRFRYFWPARFETLALGNGIAENLKANPLNYLLIPFFLASIKIKVLIESRKCDVIHAHWLPAGIASLASKYFFGKPLIVTLHGTGTRTVNRSIVGFFLKRFDAVTTGHEEMFEIAKQYVPKKLFLIRNMVDFEALKNAKKMQIKKKMVLFIGRLYDMKQPFVFIDGAAEILKKRKDVIFYMIGNGPLEEKCKTRVKKLGIEQDVVFTGRVGNVFGYLASSKVFSALSHIENIFSVSIIEALLTNTPCVITKAGKTTQFFTDRKNCLLVEKKDSKGFAKAVIELLSNETKAKEIGRNGKNLAEELGFSREKILKQNISLYSSLPGK